MIIIISLSSSKHILSIKINNIIHFTRWQYVLALRRLYLLAKSDRSLFYPISLSIKYELFRQDTIEVYRSRIAYILIYFLIFSTNDKANIPFTKLIMLCSATQWYVFEVRMRSMMLSYVSFCEDGYSFLLFGGRRISLSSICSRWLRWLHFS